MIQHESADQEMETGRFARLQAIFNEALKLPAQQRGLFIKSACAGDSDLLADITGMLEEDRSPSLLDQDVATLAQRIFEGRRGIDHARIGPYRLIGMLGEG
jgi:serine/threonine-protein kinase